MCTLAGVIAVSLCAALRFNELWFLYLLLFGILCTALEAVSPHGWDNLVMQFVLVWMAVLFFGE